MFLNSRRLGAAAILAAGMAISMAMPAAAAEPTQVIKIKVKQVIFYDSADGKPAGRIPRDQIELPLDILGGPKNGRLLVNIKGEDLWIPKMLAVTDEGAPEVTVNCQQITKSYATSRGFGNCD
ncbi:MAG: hypothetical protein IH900_08655 [Proteobacteria bacterium]|nr:hypothetical protein [Pseudomonadota bacterium]